MNKPKLATMAMLLLAIAVVGGADSPRAADVAGLIERIGSDDKAVVDAAASAISDLPASSLGELYAAIDKGGIPQGSLDRLQDAMAKIHERAAAARSKRQSDLYKNWQLAGIECYKSSGKHDPKWDKLGLDALTNYTFSKQQDAFPLFKKAVDAGCDDPLVLYYYGFRGFDDRRLTGLPSLKALSSAIKGFDDSSYPASRKIIALSRFVWIRTQFGKGDMPEQEATLIRTHLDHATELLRKLPEEKLDETLVMDMAMGLEEAYAWSLDDHQAAFDKVFAVVKESYPDSAMPLAYAAKSYRDWAWKARGGGYANTVTDNGWKLFEERLKVAETYARQGWQKDPTNPWGAINMIIVCMGQGYPREEMEKWFTRAMAADPENKSACDAKMNYVQPKWHGTPEEAIEFARECITRGNGRNRIPETAIWGYKGATGDDKEVLANPDIWKDLKDAYEKLLEDKTRLKDDRHQYLVDRANYLKLACDLKQWEDAERLAKEFGDEIDMRTLGGKAVYEKLKKQAAEEVAKQPV